MLVFARPGLDRVDVGGLPIEDVRPDRCDEGEQKTREDGGEAEGCAECVFLLELELWGALVCYPV